MDISLRQATPDDADALVRMHTSAHAESYAHLLPPEFFAAREANIEERIERRREYLDTSDPRIIALDLNGQVVGLADAGPSRDADRPGKLELYSIYALARTHGSGLGAALLQAAIGVSAADLWRLDDNPRAHAFYRKHGFVPDGARRQLPPEWCSLVEIRMVRAASLVSPRN